MFTNSEPWCLMPKKNSVLRKPRKMILALRKSVDCCEPWVWTNCRRSLNILIGDMSFVGPRSLAVGEVLTDNNGKRVNYEEIRGFWDRLKARPGLTGLATVYIPKDSSPRRKFKYDLLYIRQAHPLPGYASDCPFILDKLEGKVGIKG